MTGCMQVAKMGNQCRKSGAFIRFIVKNYIGNPNIMLPKHALAEICKITILPNSGNLSAIQAKIPHTVNDFDSNFGFPFKATSFSREPITLGAYIRLVHDDS